MFRRYLKKAAVLLTAAVMLLSSSIVSMGANQIPDTVRVGLYYSDSTVNTALSIFDVSAAAGLQAGFFSDGVFTEICALPGSQTFFVRKDAYYYNTGSGLKEYNPSGAAPSDINYGPYHIKIGGDYADASSAAAQAAFLRQSGVGACIAYADAWQVWAGSYINEDAAINDMISFSYILGDIGFSIIEPASNRIVVVNGQYQPVCFFGSAYAFFRMKPSPENNPPVINIKEKPYRGSLEVKRLASSDMTVINAVSMQEYLYGNVPPEIGGKSPDEAIKAQAIASKMYAINNMGKHGKTGFDLCATTSCQVYKGYGSEVLQCNSVIDQVKDKIITYNGQPVSSIYYFASGGGSTEDVSNVWGSSAPYLTSVEDKYEKIYTWTKTLRASDVKSKLPELGNILGISITKTAKTGRVTQLAVTSASRGEPAYYANEKCRTLFGLDSQLYTITTDADVFAASLSYAPTITAAITSAATASVDTPAGGEGANVDSMGAANSTPLTISTNDPAVSVESADDQPDGAVAGESPAIPAAFPLPDSSEPVRTLLGGKKVITAAGVKTISSTGNKISIIGEGGNVAKIPLIPETYTFTGKGWGHAVGMSQEGAIGMSKAGFTYDQILEYYFQGTNVE